LYKKRPDGLWPKIRPVRARAFCLFSKSPSPSPIFGLGLEPDPALPQGVSNWQCVHQFPIPLRSDTKFVLIGTEQQYREILAYFSFNSVLINVQGLRLVYTGNIFWQYC
jgi:hypothetical protein